jgi:hypothetical protein
MAFPAVIEARTAHGRASMTWAMGTLHEVGQIVR